MNIFDISSLGSEYSIYAKAFVGILAIVNPLGGVPIFLSLCDDRSPAERRQVANRTAFSVAIILLIVLWAGELILSFFGIGIPAFRTGGGLLILLMAIAMMHAKRSSSRQTAEEADEAENKDDIAVVPLAMPLLAGPGAISLVIIEAHQVSEITGRLVLSASIVLVAATILFTLRLATPIGDRLGVTGLNIATRIMGLLLSAIAIQMIATGLTKLLPGLAS